MAAVQVDRAQSDAMNLQVLKRQDADVMEIVDTASHVVMYEFDQDNQSWKRKEVEGCLFVVKRFSSPRFQVFVNNRLSTTNMTLAIDEHLHVSSVDSFLILRCPDAAYSSGYAIYGVWFFPEEDREKILNLLLRVVQSLKEPQAAGAIAPANGSVNGRQTQQPKAQPEAKKIEQQVQVQVQQVQEQQPVPQAQQQQPRARSRSRNKRDDSNGRRQSARVSTPTQQQQQPAVILQRSPKNGNKAGLPPAGPAQQQQQQQPMKQEPVASSGMQPISREDGIAAGEAILGMISQNRNGSQQASPSSGGGGKGGRNQRKKQQSSQQSHQQGESTSLLLPAMVSTSSTSSSPTNAESAATPVNKEQLKQTLISLLDDSQFFDQIYHAYVGRVHLRS
ncbi:hypothetical protein Gpo141_00012027 [Globisporangium polare]